MVTPIPNPITSSPFITIWTKPRTTIRQIVDNNPESHIYIISMLAGIAQLLSAASTNKLGDNFSLLAILLICIVIGMVAGVISLYIRGALYSWTGSWLGGVASSKEVRAAIAWSSVPTIFTLPLWVIMILLIGNKLFSSSLKLFEENVLWLIIFAVFLLIGLIISIWEFIISLQCLGEVHKFSAWKALLSYIFGGAVVFIPFICIVIFL